MAGSAKSSTNSRGIKNGGTEVLRCSCVNEYQDKKYGKQMRGAVHAGLPLQRGRPRAQHAGGGGPRADPAV